MCALFTLANKALSNKTQLLSAAHLRTIAAMRIAVSGTHLAGKSSLVEALADALHSYEVIDEPYHLLEEDGHEFANPPSLEDFELQLERAIESIERAPEDAIFDRSPVDFIAYALTHPDAETFDITTWQSRVQAALDELDLIVLVPIEDPDRIAVAGEEDARTEVDALLKDILQDGRYNLEVEVMVVSGTLSARAKQVLTRLGSLG